jgi:Zn-dependent protease
MSTPLVQGGRPIAKFRVFGFPVTIDISFIVVAALLGYYPGVTARGFVVWLVMVPLAVLSHELGHAFVARPTGAEPAITLAGLGGVTTYVPPHRLSRGRNVAISLAGPAVGIVIGGALVLYAVYGGLHSGGMAATIVDTAVFTTLGWSVLNLLPILPLDGGQALRELLPGSPRVRQTRAAMVSIVVGAAFALLAVKLNYLFGGLLLLFLIYSNVQTVRAARELGSQDVSQQLMVLIWSGRVDDARDLLEDSDPSQVHPLVGAAVHALSDDPVGGRSALESAVRGGDASAPGLLLLVLGARADWPAATALAQGPHAARLEPAVVQTVQSTAFESGEYAAAGGIGDGYLDQLSAGAPGTADRVPRDLRSAMAFRSTLSWARSGQPERAVASLRRASDLGFDDLTTVDSEPDLAPLRPRADYDEVRQIVRRSALARLDREESADPES